MLPEAAHEALLALGLEVSLDQSLAPWCAFGAGGEADVFVADPSDELAAALTGWAKKHKLPVLRWTGTDNVLASESGIKGVVFGPAQAPARAGRRLFQEPGSGRSVDAMVEHAGMRGIRLRGARIDPEDGNLVTNEGGATVGDVRLLMDWVQARVARDWGLQLVPDLEFIGRRRRGR